MYMYFKGVAIPPCSLLLIWAKHCTLSGSVCYVKMN